MKKKCKIELVETTDKSHIFKDRYERVLFDKVGSISAHKDYTNFHLNIVNEVGETIASSNITLDLPSVSKDFLRDFSKHPTEFQEFLGTINEECVILIDEFEKVYKGDSQEVMLNILDSTYQGKKLFIFTSNSSTINEYLINRPGRIKYSKHFDTLATEAIEEIVDDLLKVKEYKSELMEEVEIMSVVTFDTLITIIKDINLFKISPKEVIKELNIVPEDSTYKMEFYIDGNLMSSTYDEVHPLQIDDFYHMYLTKEYIKANKKANKALKYTGPTDSFRITLNAQSDDTEIKKYKGNYYMETYSKNLATKVTVKFIKSTVKHFAF